MPSTERTYTSRRSNIVEALATKLKDIDGSGAFLTDVANNVHPRLKFWDEVEDFPAYILVDDKGNDFFADVRIACSQCALHAYENARAEMKK